MSNISKSVKSIGLHLGDCFNHLESLPDHSIDAVITDPPYGTTNCAWDYKIPLQRWWELVNRKLKPKGVCAMFASGKFMYEAWASNLKHFRYELVWEKSRAVGFLDANRRPLRAHEWILVFTREFAGSTYNPQKTRCETARVGAVRKVGPRTAIYNHCGTVTSIDDGTRHPRSVLRFNSAIGAAALGHPTQKPLGLLDWLVRTYTNPGDLVADPFMGSGTTAEACAKSGRRFFGCETDRKFYATAVKRVRRRLSGVS